MAIEFRSALPLLVMGSLTLSAGTALAANVPRSIVSRVSPIYPELAHRMHVAGKVVLLVTIKPNGTVSDTKVESGHALLVNAARDAVRRWRFTPNTEASKLQIEVNFADSQ